MNMKSKTAQVYVDGIDKQSFQTAIVRAAIVVVSCSICLIPIPKITIAFAGSLTPQSLSQQPNCKNPQTQLELNQCADLKAKTTDRRLNKVYRQVQVKYKGNENENLLIDAQLIWIKYRDSACSFSSSRFKGGSIAPLVYSNCIERLTKQRADELESYLKEGEF